MARFSGIKAKLATAKKIYCDCCEAPPNFTAEPAMCDDCRAEVEERLSK